MELGNRVPEASRLPPGVGAPVKGTMASEPLRPQARPGHVGIFLCVPNSRMKQPKAQATVPSCKNQEEKESGYVTFLVSNGKGQPSNMAVSRRFRDFQKHPHAFLSNPQQKSPWSLVREPVP